MQQPSFASFVHMHLPLTVRVRSAGVEYKFQMTVNVSTAVTYDLIFDRNCHEFDTLVIFYGTGHFITAAICKITFTVHAICERGRRVINLILACDGILLHLGAFTVAASVVRHKIFLYTCTTCIYT